MAQLKAGTIAATGPVEVGSPWSDRVSCYLIGLDFTIGSFVGSVAIKGAPIDSKHTLLGLAYKNMVTGLNATSAISADGLVLVDASGLIVTLDVTRSSGTLYYTAVPLLG